MIEIRNIKLSVDAGIDRLEKAIVNKLKIKNVPDYIILKRSIDARKKPDIFYIYSIGVYLKDEERIIRRIKDKNVILSERAEYRFIEEYSDIKKETDYRKQMKHHPLIIGAGPAGLFCAYILAKCGYSPVVVERGLRIDERIHKVDDYWNGKPLDPECNALFGEGGAGTFSDGKLNTQVKDKYGRIRFVLERFVDNGADPSILYDNKPHIGTDVLVDVVLSLRNEIINLGGTFLFGTKATGIHISEDNSIDKVLLCDHNKNETWVETGIVIMAIGHSARDTFRMLYDNNIPMTAKDFAMGVRIEHPEALIRKAMYGDSPAAKSLPTPPYKLTYQTSKGRGVYSFCMCPGGYVVNASSEEGYTCVNGMSYSGRNGLNSNSALIVTVRKEDYDSEHPLAGIELQRKLEKAVYEQGNGKIVVSRYEDFKKGTATVKPGYIMPQTKGGYICGNVAKCLPEFIKDSIVEAMSHFNREIPGFEDDDAIISGVESRTSSPVRILRDESFQSAMIKGLYPCGEGAGYAGGIMSAAIDGMKVAEAIIKEYR